MRENVAPICPVIPRSLARGLLFFRLVLKVDPRFVLIPRPTGLSLRQPSLRLGRMDEVDRVRDDVEHVRDEEDGAEGRVDGAIQAPLSAEPLTDSGEGGANLAEVPFAEGALRLFVFWLMRSSLIHR